MTCHCTTADSEGQLHATITARSISGVSGSQHPPTSAKAKISTSSSSSGSGSGGGGNGKTRPGTPLTVKLCCEGACPNQAITAALPQQEQPPI
eukprot:3272538-Amphidinium_carterae.1